MKERERVDIEQENRVMNIVLILLSVATVSWLFLIIGVFLLSLHHN